MACDPGNSSVGNNPIRGAVSHVRLVSLRVDRWLVQQDRLAVCHDALELQRVEVAPISRQVLVPAHQPNLTTIFILFLVKR